MKRKIAYFLTGVLFITSVFSARVSYADSEQYSYIEDESQEAVLIDEEETDESFSAEDKSYEDTAAEEETEGLFEETEESLTETTEECLSEAADIEAEETESTKEIEENSESSEEDSEETEKITSEAEEPSEESSASTEECVSAEESEEAFSEEEIVTEETSEEETEEKAEGLISPAFFSDAQADDFSFKMVAGENVLPEDTAVSVKKTDMVSRGKILAENMVCPLIPEEKYISKIATFKIVLSSGGEKVIPVNGELKTQVFLSAAMKKAFSEADGGEIHVYQTSLKDTVCEIEASYTADSVNFSVSETAYYTVLLLEDKPDVHLAEYEKTECYPGISDNRIADDTTVLLTAGASDSKYVTPNLEPTRNQGNYGTCWAHAAMAACEIYLDKYYGNRTRNYSEAALCYATYHEKYDPLGNLNDELVPASKSSKFMMGGNEPGIALSAWQGPVDESLVPYSNAASYIESDSIPVVPYMESVARVTNVLYVDPVDDRQGTKRAIAAYGSVEIGYWSDWNYYSASYNSYYCTEDKDCVNHAVVIVGWDDDFPASNFKTKAPGNGAWKIRNSWKDGADENAEGYNSYFWMSYYDVNLEHSAETYVLTSKSTYDNLYQYDGTVQLKETSQPSKIAVSSSTTIANIYKASAWKNGETLKSVGIWTLDTGVTSVIKIYKNPTSTADPESGTLVSTKTVTFAYIGYHCTVLSDPVSLKYGDTYAIVVKQYKGQKNVQFMRDSTWHLYGNGFDCIGHASSGQSFLKGSSGWIDYGKTYGLNIAIKAYTCNVPIKYNIAFNANGGSGSMSSMTSLNPGTTYTLPINTLTRSGYIFAGWNTKADGSGTSYKDHSSFKASPSKNYTYTFYAQWTKTCKITYVLNKGTNSTGNPSSFTISSTGSITLESPTRSHYVFKGWYTTSDFRSDTKVTSLSKYTNHHYTVYAKWAMATYTLKLSANGGTGDTITKSGIKYTANYTLPKEPFTRKGYVFVGWSTSTSAKNLKYYDGETINRATSKSSITLYAIWTKAKNSAMSVYNNQVRYVYDSGVPYLTFHAESGYTGDMVITVFKPDVVSVEPDSAWGQYASLESGKKRRDLNFTPKSKGRTLIKVANTKNTSPIYIFYIND